jgi:ribosomal protein S18 acetylase RimI-like enzyme
MTTRDDIHIREGTIDDFDRYFDEGFDELSAGSRLTRFFSVMPELPETVRRSLRELDGSNHVAVIGFATDQVDDHHPEGKPVGVARWITGGEGPPELAVTVLDEFQGLGIGTMLVNELCALAAQRGFTEIIAFVLAENTPMHRILQRAGSKVIPNDDPGVVAYLLPTT